MVPSGAVSVNPHDDTNGTLRPRTLRPSFSNRSHKLCGSAAAA